MKVLTTTLYLIVIFLSISCSSYKSNQTVKSKTILNDIWVLHSIKSKIYDKSSVKHPYLEINISEKKIYGNDGCNRIRGSIKHITNKTIEFTDIAKARMRCPNMEMTNKYLRLLQKTRYFKIQNLHLTLLDSDKNIIMSFSKAD